MESTLCSEEGLMLDWESERLDLQEGRLSNQTVAVGAQCYLGGQTLGNL